MQGSHTLGKPKKPPKGPQRHSAGNIDYDNLETREQVEPPQPNANFRSRSKTVSDALGESEGFLILIFGLWFVNFIFMFKLKQFKPILKLLVIF